MKIVVIGGSGLIGAKVVKLLNARGHQAIAASPSKGVDATTGKGLAEALAGAQVVVDVANSPSFEDAAVLAFFESSGRNLASAEAKAGVRHHVALSIVGTDRLPASGYFRAKLAQEKLVQGSGIPFTIVRATQFFEFLGAIGESGLKDGALHLSSAGFQPIAADDVAAAVAEAALSAPLNGIVDIAGPDRFSLAEAVALYLQAKGDARPIVSDADAPYFGARLEKDSLVPLGAARLGSISLKKWLA